MMEAFFKLYEPLHRHAPGNDDITLAVIRDLPDRIQKRAGDISVLDLGCGKGRQTRVLALELAARVTSVDTYQPFLDDLLEQAQKDGLKDRIKTLCTSFLETDGIPGNADLIWSEGAIYLAGLENGLSLWGNLLKPDGVIVVSEAVWLTDNPSSQTRDFWQAAYPDMETIDGTIRKVEQAGFNVLGTRILPSEAWWDEYYIPLEERMELLADENDVPLTAVIAETRKEIDICREYGNEYGYLFLIMEKKS